MSFKIATHYFGVLDYVALISFIVVYGGIMLGIIEFSNTTAGIMLFSVLIVVGRIAGIFVTYLDNKAQKKYLNEKNDQAGE